MILEENRTASYIRSLYTGNTELLDTIEQEALRDYVPIIRVETQSLLKLLLSRRNPDGFWNWERLLDFQHCSCANMHHLTAM